MVNFPSPIRQEDLPPTYDEITILPVQPSSDLPRSSIPKNNHNSTNEHSLIYTPLENFRATSESNINTPEVNLTPQTQNVSNNTNQNNKKPKSKCRIWFDKHPKIKFIIQILIFGSIIAIPITVVEVIKHKKCGFGYSIKDCTLECGKTYVANNYGRIVGGRDAASYSWPSVVLIDFKYSLENGQSNSSICSGLLIGLNRVLTAASCIPEKIIINEKQYPVRTNNKYPSKESMLTVYLGVHDKRLLSSQRAVQTLSVSKIVMHEKYNRYNFHNDIAILKLKKEATLNDKVQIGCLPIEKSKKYPNPQTAYTVGWGLTSYDGENSNFLQDIKFAVLSQSNCYSMNTFPDYESQICAGDFNSNANISNCDGDQGGPLFIYQQHENEKAKYVSVGIASYGDKCALTGNPSIFTRTSYYYKWIKENSATENSFSLKTMITCCVLYQLIYVDLFTDFFI